MNTLKLQEQCQRGSADYPLEYYYVDRHHARYDMPCHWHHEHEILRVLSGVFRITLEGQEYVLRKGDAVFIATGRLHSGTPENCVYECVVFDMSLLLKCNDECRKLIWNVLHRRVRVDPVFPGGSDIAVQTLAPMFQALRARGAGAPLITLGCLYTFLGAVYQSGAYQRFGEAGDLESKRTAQLRTVFEKIERDYALPLTLAGLAETVHMSPKYFCRFFKDATHSTPIHYLCRYRIETACYLMAASEQNVTEIAMAVGFSDVNYFIRSFKKIKGVTPKRYMQLLSMEAPFN